MLNPPHLIMKLDATVVSSRPDLEGAIEYADTLAEGDPGVQYIVYAPQYQVEVQLVQTLNKVARHVE